MVFGGKSGSPQADIRELLLPALRNRLGANAQGTSRAAARSDSQESRT